MRMNWIVAPLMAASIALAIGLTAVGALAQPAGGGTTGAGGIAPTGSPTTTSAPPTAQITDNIGGTTTSMPIDATGLTIGPPPQDVTIVHTPKGYCGKDDPGGMYLGFDEKTGMLVGMFSKRPPSDPKSAFNPWKGPDRLPPGMPPCPKPTLVMNVPPPPKSATGGIKIKPQLIFDGGVGGTFLRPDLKVNYLGTAVGSGASTTFNDVNFMPTLELDIWHPIGRGMAIGTSGNFLFPVQGKSSKNVTANGVAGTQSFQQGLAFNMYVNWAYNFCDWTAYDEEDYEDCLDWYLGPPVRVYAGAGFALTQWQASNIFPGNGDNFSTGWQTTVTPSFQIGTQLKFKGFPGMVDVHFNDILPGGNVTMPGGNGASFGTAKMGNTLAFGLKWVYRLGDP